MTQEKFVAKYDGGFDPTTTKAKYAVRMGGLYQCEFRTKRECCNFIASCLRDKEEISLSGRICELSDFDIQEI